MAPGEPINIGNISGYAERAIREGTSQRGFYNAMRDAGASVTRQQVRETYNETRAAMLARGDVQALPYHRIPDAGSFSPWRAGSPGTYAYQLNINIRDTETGAVTSRPWTVTSAQPISINKAIAIATGQAQAGADSGKYQNEQVDGGTLDNLYVMVE